MHREGQGNGWVPMIPTMLTIMEPGIVTKYMIPLFYVGMESTGFITKVSLWVGEVITVVVLVGALP